ncbi:sentrin-specific protease 1-like [Rhopalosiphum padi]|uniref:sentrin-specific protease 1-like n=1 Tax=Rhopalosiphum padi TaxID=40932 RepID=UPI00298DC29E|nr:sentrin-specific protease 1-like [Rhopalosiphum padi]
MSTSLRMEECKSSEYSSALLSSNKQFITTRSKDLNSCHKESRSATDTQDMDQQLILEVIDLVSSDDENVVGTSLPKISEKMNLGRINYIQSDRQNIIFPGVFNPHLWMSDCTMEHYFSLLAKSCTDQLILSLPPVFFKDLVRGGFDKATNSMTATIKNVYAYDKLITPTYLEGNHWTLTVVNIKSRTITLYDSIKSSIYEDQINLLVEFLIESYKKYEKPVDEEQLQWTLDFGDSPLQSNTSDCGVFTCTNARHVLLGKPLYYTQEDAPLLRHRITFEILNNVLLPTPDAP